MGLITSLRFCFYQELVSLSCVATYFESWVLPLELHCVLSKNFGKTLGSQIGYGNAT